MIILWNNEWIKPDQATIPLFSEAVLYGLGAFETLRANPGPSIIEPAAHVERLFNSLDAIGLPIAYSQDDILAMLQKVAEQSPAHHQRMRLMVVPEGISISSESLIINPHVYKGVALKVVTQNRPLPTVKSLSYLECLLSYRSAQDDGYFEALMVDERGEVFEGSRSNIFWFEDQTLCTRDRGVLPGITRQLVLDSALFPIRYEIIRLPELLRKSEVFMTNTTQGVVPVVKIDESIIGSGLPGQNTLRQRDALKRFYF